MELEAELARLLPSIETLVLLGPAPIVKREPAARRGHDAETQQDTLRVPLWGFLGNLHARNWY